MTLTAKRPLMSMRSTSVFRDTASLSSEHPRYTHAIVLLVDVDHAYGTVFPVILDNQKMNHLLEEILRHIYLEKLLVFKCSALSF